MTQIHRALELATDTKDLIIEASAVERVSEVFTRHFPDRQPLVVADDNTFHVAGERVDGLLRASHPSCPESQVFPGSPVLHPEYEHIRHVSEILKRHDAIGVAVGSGTINDIVKLASHEAGRRYMAVATAASMDGYASFGAAILKDGFKQTLPCAAPLSVLADVSLLTHSPYNMTASGYGDLLGKVTAGADWLIADVLGTETIDRNVWALVQSSLRSWTDDPRSLKAGDPDALAILFEGLIMSALAMQAYGGTRPASGTEHLFSHVWEMQGLEVAGVPVSHGFKVGMGTLAASAFMEELFRGDLTREDRKNAVDSWEPREERERAVRAAFSGAPFLGEVVRVSMEKHLDRERHAKRLDCIFDRWDVIRQAVARQLLPFDRIMELLDLAGCPVEPADAGLDTERLALTFSLAHMIRPRYTVLDLAYELGRLEDTVGRVFSSGVYF